MLESNERVFALWHHFRQRHPQSQHPGASDFEQQVLNPSVARQVSNEPAGAARCRISCPMTDFLYVIITFSAHHENRRSLCRAFYPALPSVRSPLCSFRATLLLITYIIRHSASANWWENYIPDEDLVLYEITLRVSPFNKFELTAVLHTFTTDHITIWQSFQNPS